MIKYKQTIGGIVMKRAVSIILAFVMVVGICTTAFAEMVATDATVAGGKISAKSSIQVNKDAKEKFGDVYRTNFMILSYDDNGILKGVKVTDNRINQYLTLGKETEVDFSKIAVADGATKAKVFSFTDGFVKPEFSGMPEKITVHILGASTTTDSYGESSYPQQGWGYQFDRFFDDNVTINNVARGGWSLKALQEASIKNSKETDIGNSVYSNMMNKVVEGDYVIISSTGLNEQYQKQGDRYDEAGNLVYTWRENPEEYKRRLRNTIREIKEKNATPIVLNAMGQNGSSDFMYPEETETEYAMVIQELADEMGFIFLNHRTAFYNYVRSRGINYRDFKKYFIMSKTAKQWYKENDHVGKSDMEEDDIVHFTTIGAWTVADIIIAELKKTNCGLLHYIKY